jgi:hypothetical protein
VKRKNRDFSSREYGSGQINAYPPTAAGNPAAVAGMMTLAEELLTKKGLSLKDLQVRYHYVVRNTSQLGFAVNSRAGVVMALQAVVPRARIMHAAVAGKE